MIDKQSTEFKRAEALLVIVNRKIGSLERVIGPNPRFQAHFPSYTLQLTEAIQNVFIEAGEHKTAPKFISPTGVDFAGVKYVADARKFTSLCEMELTGN